MLRRRYPLSRRRPRIIPPARVIRQSPMIETIPVQPFYGELLRCEAQSIIDQLGFTMTLAFKRTVPLSSLLAIIQRLAADQGVLLSDIHTTENERGITFRIRRDPTRQARISPKLAAFFGWSQTSK